MTFVGDGNNVARSLAEACGRLGVRFVLASPGGYEFPSEAVDEIMARVPELDFVLTRDPEDAVREADVVVTDTWVSMGQEAQKAQRQRDFHGFIVDEQLMAAAPKHAVVLHCLPAYRGYEISEGVLEGPRSLIFPEAENRLHLQKGLLAVLMGGQ
jgi:ornithine carbamoyltransferase